MTLGRKVLSWYNLYVASDTLSHVIMLVKLPSVFEQADWARIIHLVNFTKISLYLKHLYIYKSVNGFPDFLMTFLSTPGSILKVLTQTASAPGLQQTKAHNAVLMFIDFNRGS